VVAGFRQERLEVEIQWIDVLQPAECRKSCPCRARNAERDVENVRRQHKIRFPPKAYITISERGQKSTNEGKVSSDGADRQVQQRGHESVYYCEKAWGYCRVF
jgi:hypothetical protein